MTEKQYLMDKFKARDVIDVDEKTVIKVLNWVIPGTMNSDGQKNILHALRPFVERGFIKFLDKGVILMSRIDPRNHHLSCYPFEFKDNGILIQSIYITNPHADDEDKSLELLCKVSVGTDLLYHVENYNKELAAAHIVHELAAERIGLSSLTPFISYVRKENKDVIDGKVKVGSDEFNNLVAQEYFTNIIKAQVYSCVALHAYLVLMDKELLFSENKQKRTFQASDRTEAKMGKRNPLYRYIVRVSDDYQPRKFNLNYLLAQWNRIGYRTTRWVRKENAETLAKRDGSVITNRVKGDLIALEVTVKPQVCHRRCATPKTEITGIKTYTP